MKNEFVTSSSEIFLPRGESCDKLTRSGEELQLSDSGKWWERTDRKWQDVEWIFAYSNSNLNLKRRAFQENGKYSKYVMGPCVRVRKVQAYSVQAPVTDYGPAVRLLGYS